MINNFDKFFFTTLQEVTLHLPTYQDLYTKLESYQRDYMAILNNLSSNTTELQTNTELLAKALEQDDFASASTLDENINELQAQTIQYKAEVNAMNEYINQQQDLLAAILATTRTDAAQMDKSIASSDDNADSPEPIDITADATLILPISLLSEEFNLVLKALKNAIAADKAHTSSLLTTLQQEKADLSTENDDTTAGIAEMKDKIEHFVQDAQTTKTNMLQQHDELGTDITTLEDEIAELERTLAAKKDELVQKKQQQEDLGNGLISYDETSKNDHVALQNEYHGLQEYQLDLVERIGLYDQDVEMVEKFIQTQIPQNDTVIQVQEQDHQSIYSTFVHPYNCRQQALQKDIIFDHFDTTLFSHKNQITTILSSIGAKLQEAEEKQGELLTVQSNETQCLKDIADIDQVIPLLQAEKKQAITMKAFDKAGAITTQYNICVSNKTAKEELLLTLRAQQDELNLVIANLEEARNTVANELIACIHNCSSASSTKGASLTVTDAQKEQLLGLLKQSQNDQRALKEYAQKRTLELSKAAATGACEPQLFSSELSCPSTQGKEQNETYQQAAQNTLKFHSTWLYSYSPIVLQSFIMLLEIESTQLLRLCNLTKCDIKQLAGVSVPLNSAPILALADADVSQSDENQEDLAPAQQDDSEVVQSEPEEENAEQEEAETPSQEPQVDTESPSDEQDDGVDAASESVAEEAPVEPEEQDAPEIAICTFGTEENVIDAEVEAPSPVAGPLADDDEDVEEIEVEEDAEADVAAEEDIEVADDAPVTEAIDSAPTEEPAEAQQEPEAEDESGFAFMGDDEEAETPVAEPSQSEESGAASEDILDEEPVAQDVDAPEAAASLSAQDDGEAESFDFLEQAEPPHHETQDVQPTDAQSEPEPEQEEAEEEQEQEQGGFDFLADDADDSAPASQTAQDDSPADDSFAFLNESSQNNASDKPDDQGADSIFDFLNPAPVESAQSTLNTNAEPEDDNSAFDFM
jgi:predicted  nucleic acid-binding Zn-ribbon protein